MAVNDVRPPAYCLRGKFYKARDSRREECEFLNDIFPVVFIKFGMAEQVYRYSSAGDGGNEDKYQFPLAVKVNGNLAYTPDTVKLNCPVVRRGETDVNAQFSKGNG